MMPFHGFHFIYGEYVNLNNASFSVYVLPPLRVTKKVINAEMCKGVWAEGCGKDDGDDDTTLSKTEHNAANPKP